jgi:hypothetical protein
MKQLIGVRVDRIDRHAQQFLRSTRAGKRGKRTIVINVDARTKERIDKQRLISWNDNRDRLVGEKKRGWWWKHPYCGTTDCRRSLSVCPFSFSFNVQIDGCVYSPMKDGGSLCDLLSAIEITENAKEEAQDRIKSSPYTCLII